ncbi:glycogen debranching protein GlgX [Synechococcus sp. CCAP 1479/9]|uniref:glycogen debranching protein GlgX n=1 Tax=Synechococcus sp. CCAP 1479/9 TaxID=1221593 RepID=UPI001C24F157|nr:glycogen debranching protein GlgX [Synechococcus sp. CCAP 1479/9]
MTPSTAAPPSPGSSAPLGASLSDGGVNFSLYARRATAVELCLFDRVEDAEPLQRLTLDPARHRTGDYWHVQVGGIGPGQLYGWRVEGPWQPALGMRFDPTNLLLDPHGLALAMPPGYGRAPGRSSAGDWGSAMKNVVADPLAYDWEGDRPLHRPSRETVIYELHVRGFTAHPSAGVPPEQAGTYRGLISKIPYLQDLGITAVELLPVFAFDPLAAPAGLRNYWGYQPVSFFAPHPGYACSSDPLAVIDEFRDLVKALHRAGIEVILDVVFNHTAEGDAGGPAFCFRGQADGDYYLQHGDGTYIDVTGCGNTFNTNHPVVRRLIHHSLRHWVQHLHVDGFRFDLASVLDRDQTGQPTPLSPILWDIDTDPVLAGTKLIAEAWDAAGLYQVGSFVGDNWQEWNGRFRDDVRRFIKGDRGLAASVGQRLIGSPDIYGHKQREAEASVNFITCHDGFTLADLVSYDGKHNDANGEDNRDGSDDNASWNCGVEGPTQDAEVLRLRARQSRNLLTLLLLATGTPMLAMGDEMGRSQQGNNNAYAQDNAISWLDWSLLERRADLHRFVRELVRYRQQRDVVVHARNLSLGELVQRHQVSWHGVEPNQPDWSDSSHAFAVTITSVGQRFRWHAMVNAWWEPLLFRLPPAGGDQPSWRCWIDTSRPSPEDIVPWSSAPALETDTYTLGPRSIVVLVVGLSPGAAAGDGHPDPPAAGPDQPRATPPDPPA